MDRISLDKKDPKEAVNGIYLAQLASGDEMSIQHFQIDPGEGLPEHQHPYEQAGFIYQGELTVTLEDGTEITIKERDSYVLSRDEFHSVENQSDEIVRGIDVFSPPRLNPTWME